MVGIIQAVVVVGMIAYAIMAFRDVGRTKNIMSHEKGKMPFYCLTSFLAMFLGTFGVSDSAVSIFMYKASKTVKDKNLPGTVITGAILPVGVMSLTYLSYMKVDPVTLLACVACACAGAILGVKIIVRLNEHVIRYVMAITLTITAFLLVFKLFFFGISGGDKVGLDSWQLIVAMAAFFIFGGLNMIGMGATVPDMAVLLLLGMNAKIVFPIIMTSNILSCFFGGFKFVKEGVYTRKAVLASFAGVAAVLLAVNLVKIIDVSVLQVVMIGLLLYCAFSMVWEERKSRRPAQT